MDNFERILKLKGIKALYDNGNFRETDYKKILKKQREWFDGIKINPTKK